MKTIKDYDQFKNILPYSSEMFGVYQPLLGWKSKRQLKRIEQDIQKQNSFLVQQLIKHFSNQTMIRDYSLRSCELSDIVIDLGDFTTSGQLSVQSSGILQEIKKILQKKPAKTEDEWQDFITNYDLKKILHDTVYPAYKEVFRQQCQQYSESRSLRGENTESMFERVNLLKQDLYTNLLNSMQNESKIARVITELASNRVIKPLNQIFYTDIHYNSKTAFWNLVKNFTDDYKDPYLTFDPKKDVDNVSLSPLGIVHLFRQYFFEFDTFLGSPTGHVWLAPGSTVELIEISTRKTITEKYYETGYESITKTEKSTTEQDEISTAVKEDNKSDLKLGFTTTVNQSWGTGNASATASLNMDRTQQTARENTHKKMREQTQKLSSEIRENFKSTFKTITEESNTSSKRYVLANNTPDLINYELRRKMRQVGVQVQDIGSFLCWETFVDEPGEALGLANLVHIAKPADLIPKPVISETMPPPDSSVNFTVPAVWDFGDNRKWNVPGLGFVPLTTFQVPPPPDGFELLKANYPDGYINIKYISHSGEDSENQIYAFHGKFTPDFSQIEIGVITAPGGLEWDERIDFVVGGTLHYTVAAAKLAEIKAGNDAKKAAITQIEQQNAEATRQAFLNAAKERIEMASNIQKRKYEELREEERIIVYRRLIRSLMTNMHYKVDTEPRTLHVLSELINSIFDVNKMLYFVAPEWWKPRKKSSQFLGVGDFQSINADAVNWSDNVPREDNYLITDKSQPAPMGSSLGWLLQLDGDNMRNAFLNAPWVKAVIPIRPGKERAAINWLKNVNVEGSEGLDAAYMAPQSELDEIKTKLLALDPADEVAGHAQVTINDAIRFLCTQVSQKHAESNKTDHYPKGAEIHDDDKVSATPIDKVYEYGFYPLQGSFRYDPADPDPNNPDKNFQVFDQWVEILPTDQVVPVKVTYNPLTGRQEPPV
ncbi:peptidoglycan-binding protein [Legionella quinlivanii]|uniref:peptidoglycan-binding protein n=1 Tax=Legionella quinlivanii TaxID=45073 RepID=UPI002243A504|nr:peptidoglycan-binding protein [Legionella quinlivanii]MCW8451323.1 peptidoglycan-binding protein [Legionella quinlivanii]